MNKQLFKVFRGEDIVAHKFGNQWYFSNAIGMGGGFYSQFGEHIMIYVIDHGITKITT